MQDFDADNYAARIDDASSAAEVDSVFAGIEKLPPQQRTQVLALLEQDAIGDLRVDVFNVKKFTHAKMVVELVDGVKGTADGKELVQKLEEEADIGMRVASARVIENLYRLRGDAAHPFVKAYAQETAAIPAHEAGTLYGLLKAGIRAAEKLLPPPAPVVVPEEKPAPSKSQNFDL